METKKLDIKLDEQGEGSVSAFFSRFNVVDHDGDVTAPDAFENGAKVSILPAHDIHSYAIGTGYIRVTPEGAVMDGKFNLKTDLGRNWYESIKQDHEDGKPLQEWSYGYRVLDYDPIQHWQGMPASRFLKKLKTREVSPVLEGAGIETYTSGIKALAYGEQSDALILALKSYVEHTRERQELRGKEGRTLSTLNRQKIADLRNALQELGASLEELLAATEPKPKADDALALFADFLALQAKLNHTGA